MSRQPFCEAVSSILLQPCWILVLCLPARWFKLIQQFFGSKWLHCVLHWNGSLWLNLGDEHSYLFVFSLISCLLWFIHFEVVIMMSTDNCCMLCGCRFLHLPWTASDTAPVMRRTYLLLCVSFILEFLLPVQSLHYQVASLPGNPPVHCRRLRRVSCNQLFNIACPRLWGSDVPIVPVSLIHVTPWTVVAGNNPPLELDKPIQATASPFPILDVPVFHRQ